MPAKTAQGPSQGQASHDRSLQASPRQQFGASATREACHFGAPGRDRQDYQSESPNVGTVTYIAQYLEAFTSSFLNARAASTTRNGNAKTAKTASRD